MTTPAPGRRANNASPIAAAGVSTLQLGEPIAIERQRQTTLREQHRGRLVRVDVVRESRPVAGTGRRGGVRLEGVMAPLLRFPARTGAWLWRDALH